MNEVEPWERVIEQVGKHQRVEGLMVKQSAPGACHGAAAELIFLGCWQCLLGPLEKGESPACPKAEAYFDSRLSLSLFLSLGAAAAAVPQS